MPVIETEVGHHKRFNGFVDKESGENDLLPGSQCFLNSSSSLYEFFWYSCL